jgi:hypothetical protein
MTKENFLLKNILLSFVFGITFNTHAQSTLIDSNLIFPNQEKFQVLYEDLGKKVSEYDAIKQKLLKYFVFVKEEPSTFNPKGKYLYLKDPSKEGKNVVIIVSAAADRYNRFEIEYSKDDYLELFGLPWDKEATAVETISNLEYYPVTDLLHQFGQLNKDYKGLSIKHSHISKKSFHLKVEYTGIRDGEMPEVKKDPIKKGDIYASVFPSITEYRFKWMAYQLGRKEKRDLYYDFLPYLSNISIDDNTISGYYAKNNEYHVTISRSPATQLWNTLKIVATRKPGDAGKFNLFKCTWKEECEFAKTSKAFKSVLCEDGKHTFLFGSSTTITHSINDENEIVELIDLNKRDPIFKEKYYTEYTLPGPYKSKIEYKGRTNAQGAPDGNILVKYNPTNNKYSSIKVELTVKDGKVVNNPEKPYELALADNFFYRGPLDPDTWRPKGIGKYKYEITQGEGSNKKKGLIIYSGVFTDYLEVHKTKPVYIENTLINSPYKGTMRLYDIVEIDFNKEFTYEGKASFTPAEHENERYEGYFIRIQRGSYSYRFTYPAGEHIHQKYINGVWKTVDKTIYNVIDGTIKGENYYGNYTKFDFNIKSPDLFLYPNKSLFDELTEKKITQSTYNVLKNFRVARNKVAGEATLLSNNGLFGIMGKRKNLKGFEPLYKFPGFNGIIVDINALNEHRHTGQFVASYYFHEPFKSDQELLLTANKINNALYKAAGKYYRNELLVKKYVGGISKSKSFYDENEVVKFTYSGLDEQPVLSLRIYIKDNVIQYLVMFTNSI